MIEPDQVDDFLSFVPEPAKAPGQAPGFWNILIVDDDESVHEVTRFALKGLAFEGWDMQFYSVYSAAEAIELLKTGVQEFQVILLDIVMEHRRAGLEVITYVRNEIKNALIQIVVRTGNPGLAPENDMVHHYEINDYKEKNTLTVQRLKTALTTALRNYRNLDAVRQMAAQQLEEVQELRQTLRRISLIPERPVASDESPATLSSLPFFLRHPQQNWRSLPVPGADIQAKPDVGLSLQFIQGKIASTARKAIAIFDHTTNQCRYLSDNMEEVSGFAWNDLVQKFRQGGHYSPDLFKIDKISKQLTKAYAETPDSEKAQFVAVFDYRITPVAPQNTRILEYITPLLFDDRGRLLLSLHLFSNINHLKKAGANSILALHLPGRHRYFSISDYRIDEIFFGQREEEIIAYSDKNLVSREIAQQINLSVHTVDTHLRNLRDRLGVISTNALISYCKEITHLFGN